MSLSKKRSVLICTVIAFVIAFGMIHPVASFGEDENKAVTAGPADGFKVIGYYCGEWFDVSVEKLQADKLTHVMYGFLIPREDGTCKPFLEPEELTKLIEKCHSAGTQVYVSVGGYSEKNGPPLAGVFEKIGADEGLRETFAENVIDVVEQYGFDGVEMDWEYPREATGADYEKTIALLSEKLKPLGKGLSTALPGTGSTDGQNVWEALTAVTDKTLECFDFISLMCYDLHSDPNHSPIWFANTTINYWENFRNLPAEKIVLGMPLYARPSWQQYRFLVEMDRENAYKDYVKTEPLESTYNGLNTLREKTMIALRKAGGVMLFDVNEDTYDDTSAVSMIDDTLTAMDGLNRKEIDSYIWVVADNKAIAFTSKDGMGIPFIDGNSRTLVPVRKLLESIGAEVGFTSDERGNVVSVTASRDGTQILLNIGSSAYSVNGKALTMDTAAVIKNGRTYIPARPVLEAFGYTVTYSEAGKCVYAVSGRPASL
ncbi:MAG TPA: glycosyl hydrolase family 18 protein [Bacillota bacterium]|nr:glycosyl hydrolase family 18 protein [Bacillota bacterium]